VKFGEAIETDSRKHYDEAFNLLVNQWKGTSRANIISIGRHFCRQILICEASYHKLFLTSSNSGLNEDVLVPGHVVHPSAGQAAPDNSLSLNFGGVRQLQIWFYTISILSHAKIPFVVSF
jgi:hypothetical protein